MVRPRPFRPAPVTRRGFALADAIIGGVMLALSLSVALTITSRSLAMQTAGEKRMTASWLADGLLNMVLVEGPTQYPRLYDVAGRFEPPFEAFDYEVEIDLIGRGLPYRTTTIVRWGDRDNEFVLVEAHIAERVLREDETAPPREPLEPVDREARYYDDVP